MYDYINGIIENAGELYKEGSGSATPAPDHLFDIREPNEADNELLPKDEKEEYHTITAQCLYLSNRGRPDIQQSIAFHYMRVNNPT